MPWQQWHGKHSEYTTTTIPPVPWQQGYIHSTHHITTMMTLHAIAYIAIITCSMTQCSEKQCVTHHMLLPPSGEHDNNQAHTTVSGLHSQITQWQECNEDIVTGMTWQPWCSNKDVMTKMWQDKYEEEEPAQCHLLYACLIHQRAWWLSCHIAGWHDNDVMEMLWCEWYDHNVMTRTWWQRWCGMAQGPLDATSYMPFQWTTCYISLLFFLFLRLISSFLCNYSSTPCHQPTDSTCLHNCFLLSTSLDFYGLFLLTCMYFFTILSHSISFHLLCHYSGLSWVSSI